MMDPLPPTVRYGSAPPDRTVMSQSCPLGDPPSRSSFEWLTVIVRRIDEWCMRSWWLSFRN
jgi:hypothetical protein